MGSSLGLRKDVIDLQEISGAKIQSTDVTLAALPFEQESLTARKRWMFTHARTPVNQVPLHRRGTAFDLNMPDNFSVSMVRQLD